MKLKTPLLIVLFLISPMLSGLPVSGLDSVTDLESVYGIEPGTSYPGTLVLELVTELENEASQVVSEAFNEGFKEGFKTSAPEVEYWKSQFEKAQADKLPWWVVPVVGLVSAMAGVLGGLLVTAGGL